MDCNFKEPTLTAKKTLYKVLRGKVQVEVLTKYLKEHGMVGLLSAYARKGYIPEEPGLEESAAEDTGLDTLGEEDLFALCEEAAKKVQYERFVRASRRLVEINKSVGLKFDVYLAEIRMLLLLEQEKEAAAVIKRTESLIELGVDWGRKNKFKVYCGMFCMLEKEYHKAAELFFDSLSTFEGEEFVTYRELVHYSVFCGILTLSRAEIGKKLIDSSEVREVIKDIAGAEEIVGSFYECDYSKFFSCLVLFAEELLDDAWLKDRADYFIYMMKVRIYNQLFMSYKAISLEQMSGIFGVRREYVHADIETMILREDVLCKINHSNMMIYNTPAEKKDGITAQTEELSHKIQKMISTE
ncbi:26S proteasome regulatory subunit N7 [Nematocida sp. AWRm77]|nr:26S proteasome regulatory subunit N7 [Nematocida sp. AWRm77]